MKPNPPSPPLILALDTAFAQGGAALLNGENPLAHINLNNHQPHLTTLPPAVANLLQIHAANTLSLIAITTGPGSFTGLRITLGLAKGLSLAHNIPIIGLTTLEVWAGACGVKKGMILSVMDAKRGELAAALYRAGEPPEPLLPPRLLTPQELISWAREQKQPLHLTGPDWQRELLAACPEYLLPTPHTVAASEPVTLARLAWMHFQTGMHHSPATLEPFYLRPSDAETMRQTRELSP